MWTTASHLQSNTASTTSAKGSLLQSPCVQVSLELIQGNIQCDSGRMNLLPNQKDFSWRIRETFYKQTHKGQTFNKTALALNYLRTTLFSPSSPYQADRSTLSAFQEKRRAELWRRPLHAVPINQVWITCHITWPYMPTSSLCVGWLCACQLCCKLEEPRIVVQWKKIQKNSIQKGTFLYIGQQIVGHFNPHRCFWNVTENSFATLKSVGRAHLHWVIKLRFIPKCMCVSKERNKSKRYNFLHDKKLLQIPAASNDLNRTQSLPTSYFSFFCSIVWKKNVDTYCL